MTAAPDHPDAATDAHGASVRVSRQARLSGASCAGVVAIVDYAVTATNGPVLIEAVAQHVPDGWSFDLDRNPGWRAQGDFAVASPGQMLPTAGHVDVRLHLTMADDEPGAAGPLPTLQLRTSTPDDSPVAVTAPGPLAPPPLTPPALRLEASATPRPGHARFDVHNDSPYPVGAIAVELAGATTSRDAHVRVVHPGASEPVEVPTSPGGEVSARVVAATNPNGVAVEAHRLPSASARALHHGDAAPGADSPEPAAARVERAQAERRQRDYADAMPEGAVELTTEPGDTSGAKRRVDVVAIELATGGTLAVGRQVEVEAVVANPTGDDQQFVTVVAHLPSSVTLKDPRWVPHRPGAVQLVQHGLPAGHVVRVPIRVRLDKAGALNIRFEVT